MRSIRLILSAASRHITARTIALTVATLCGAGAFAISFHTLSALARDHGLPPGLAQVWALVVDVTILGGTVAHMAMPTSWYARIVFLGAAAVSIAGNVIFAQQFGAVGIAMAVFPPVALLALVHLCVQLASQPTTSAAPHPTPLWVSSTPGPNLAAHFNAKNTRTTDTSIAPPEPAAANA